MVCLTYRSSSNVFLNANGEASADSLLKLASNKSLS